MQRDKNRTAKEVAAALSENLDMIDEVVDATPPDEIRNKVADAIELGIAMRDAEQAATDE